MRTSRVRVGQKGNVMASERRRISVGGEAGRVPEGQHICLIFQDDEEQRRTIARFLRSGLDEEERVLYLADTERLDSTRDWLDEHGVSRADRPEAVVLEEAAFAYCPHGTFQVESMLEVVREFYRDSLRQGFAGARGTGEMSWALHEGRARKIDLMEYEARLTAVLEEHPYTACCQYDARRFDGETIMDVLSVHPMVFVRGRLLRNPHFVPPGEFLEEYRRRHGKATRENE